jgi:hypothetical protein
MILFIVGGMIAVPVIIGVIIFLRGKNEES